MNYRKKTKSYERLRRGLEESMAYCRGELSLKTTELPAPPPKAKARQIAELRRRLRMSQAVFAATLNVSPKTVQSWEQGIRQPADAALRLLQLISERPEVVQMLLPPRNVSGRRPPSKVRRRDHRMEKAGA